MFLYAISCVTGMCCVGTMSHCAAAWSLFCKKNRSYLTCSLSSLIVISDVPTLPRCPLTNTINIASQRVTRSNIEHQRGFGMKGKQVLNKTLNYYQSIFSPIVLQHCPNNIIDHQCYALQHYFVVNLINYSVGSVIQLEI